MKNVFFVDLKTKTECWGKHEETSEDLTPLRSGRLKNHLTDFKIIHELKIDLKRTIGNTLADFISIDEKKLLAASVGLPKNEEDYGPLNGYSEALSVITEMPIMNTHSVADPLHSLDLIGLANMVVLFRKYVDLWQIYPKLFSVKWLDNFFDLLDMNDCLPEISGIPDIPYPITDRNIWTVVEPGILAFQEEGCDFPRLDLSATHPEDNAKILLEALEGQDKENSIDPNWVPVWEYSYIPGCFYHVIVAMIETSATISKCKNCGKYFVPEKRSDTLYCDRAAPQDGSKTCKQYGARAAWEKTLKENETIGLYRKIYMSKQMLAKRNPDRRDYSESFEKYKAQSKQWKADVKAETKTEEEFITWLKEVKEKKVL